MVVVVVAAAVVMVVVVSSSSESCGTRGIDGGKSASSSSCFNSVISSSHMALFADHGHDLLPLPVSAHQGRLFL